MKISTNSIGNYSPNIRLKNAQHEKFNLEASQNIQTKNTVAAETNITQDEKKYFMDLYPENTSEINDYHFYQKSGKMTGITLGSNIDRRG